ncbi:hypothetical protein M011DRAFT_460870 [Sporormia fimetaria CBS 119925]|uniref:Uncharacterized protein n=1 Tax=Sporormia fimetaria CBS 119925 TaxID=1340428 RepID=A0A6A6V220_9PLEO|nr:hypothetical protein M011DRAFT_460870 [Sporormia fimetaria CBS 119925]
MCILLPIDHLACTHTVTLFQHCLLARRSKTRGLCPCQRVRQHQRPIVTRKLCINCGGPRVFGGRGGVGKLRGVEEEVESEEEEQEVGEEEREVEGEEVMEEVMEEGKEIGDQHRSVDFAYVEKARISYSMARRLQISRRETWEPSSHVPSLDTASSHPVARDLAETYQSKPTPNLPLKNPKRQSLQLRIRTDSFSLPSSLPSSSPSPSPSSPPMRKQRHSDPYPRNLYTHTLKSTYPATPPHSPSPSPIPTKANDSKTPPSTPISEGFTISKPLANFLLLTRVKETKGDEGGYAGMLTRSREVVV